MDNVKELFKWYLQNQESLVEKYNGKYIVIVNNSVVDCFDDENDAYFAAQNKYGLGNFLIQWCAPGEEAYTVDMYSCNFYLPV